MSGARIIEVASPAHRNTARQRGCDAAAESKKAAAAARKAGLGTPKDPTTTEQDYTAAEVEFMLALDDYKRTRNRPFPTCSEVLGVLKALGYAKADPSA